MFELLSAAGDALSFVSDHRYAALAIAAAAVGAAARAYVPVAGGAIARPLFAVAIGLACFDGGYSLRAREDRSAALAADVERLRQEIEATTRVAEAAKQRFEAAQEDRAADQQMVADYEEKLAKLGDCALSGDDARSLQQLGRKAAPAGRAGRIRKPGAAP